MPYCASKIGKVPGIISVPGVTFYGVGLRDSNGCTAIGRRPGESKRPIAGCLEVISKLPQDDDDASKMEEARIHSNQALIADYQPAEIAQPGEGALDFPPMLVSLLDFGRRFLVSPVSAVRHQKANSLACQTGPQFVRVISLITDEALGSALGAPTTLPGHFDGLQGLFRQPYFRRRCRGNGASQRNTLAVDHHHPLRALAPLGFSDSGAPFFAGAKLASMKASCQSKAPSASNCARKMRQIFSQSSCSSQRLKRRQQVEGLGYCGGRSCQRAPVRSIQRIPSKTSRLGAWGRPPLEPGFSGGSNGAILAHCSSVRNFRIAAIGLPPIAYYAKTSKKSSFIN